MIWLFGNMIIGAITNSGAFEIYYQDQEMWSSLKHKGQLPKLHDILEGADRVGLKMMHSVSDEYSQRGRR